MFIKLDCHLKLGKPVNKLGHLFDRILYLNVLKTIITNWYYLFHFQRKFKMIFLAGYNNGYE
jgi:hypothetical protein